MTDEDNSKPDFLSSVISRGMGHLPVLQRRRPSLFEPLVSSLVASNHAPVIALDEVEEKVSSPRVTSAPPGPPPTSTVKISDDGVDREPSPIPAQRPREIPATAPLANPFFGDLGLTGLIRKPPARGVADSDPTLPQTLTAIGDSEDRSARFPAPSVGRAFIETIVETERVFVSRDQPAPRPAPQPTIASTVPASARPRSTRPPTPRIETLGKDGRTSSVHRDKPPQPSLERWKPLANQVNRRAVARRDSIAKPAALTELTEPPPPQVQITIGRVEVRAAPNTVSSKAPRSIAPKLSLDDYLHARTRGS